MGNKSLKSSKEYRNNLYNKLKDLRNDPFIGTGKKIAEILLKDEQVQNDNYKNAKELHRKEGRKDKYNRLLNKLNLMEGKYNEIVGRIQKIHKENENIKKALGVSSSDIDNEKKNNVSNLSINLLEKGIENIKNIKSISGNYDGNEDKITNPSEINDKIAYMYQKLEEMNNEYDKLKKQQDILNNKLKKIINHAENGLSKETPETKALKSAFEEILKLNPNDISTGNILLSELPEGKLKDVLNSNNINYVIRVKDFDKDNTKSPNLYIVVRKEGLGKDKNDLKVNIYGKNIMYTFSELDMFPKSKIHDISIKEYQEISGKYEKRINDPRLHEELYK